MPGNKSDCCTGIQPASECACATRRGASGVFAPLTPVSRVLWTSGRRERILKSIRSNPSYFFPHCSAVARSGDYEGLAFWKWKYSSRTALSLNTLALSVKNAAVNAEVVGRKAVLWCTCGWCNFWIVYAWLCWWFCAKWVNGCYLLQYFSLPGFVAFCRQLKMVSLNEHANVQRRLTCSCYRYH